jgi:RNA polymerase sigma-70 factor (ECF subfamily)
VNENAPSVTLSDEELVEKARKGHTGAMNELVTRHHASAFRVALGILREEDGAADVAQDAFLKAFKALEKFRGDSSFKTWLLTIAANEARGVLRKRGRRKETGLEEVGPLASREEGPEEDLQKSQEAERIKAYLGELPEKQRQAVTLRIFEGLSFREVGALIGSSEGAARVNYHHGIRRLREMFE